MATTQDVNSRHVLRIYVDSHCDVCRESRHLASAMDRQLPWLTVELVNIDQQEPVDEIFAVPTFCYRGHILSLGNPTEDELCGRIMAIDRESGDGVAALARSTASREEKRGRLATCCGAAGVGGALLCSLSMIASMLGLFALHGRTAASSSWLVALLQLGPALVTTSTLLVAIASVLLGGRTVLLAIAGGIMLYGGMYGQSNVHVTEGAMTLGVVLLVAAYVRALPPHSVERAVSRRR